MSTAWAPFRRMIPWLLVVVVGLGALAAAVVGASTSRTLPTKAAASSADYAPPTGFGGYMSQGNVTQIEAEWRVPRILDPGRAGTAEATWIGAQGRSADDPFIQLGTEGVVNGSPFLGPGSGAIAESPTAPALSQAAYVVFWSDTSEQYRPIPIVGLSRPGDLISFKMTRNDAAWRLTVKNLTVGWSRAVTVHYGQQDKFSEGEWTQEDPGGYTPGTDAPYAATSSVSFERVLENGRTPRFRYEDESGLSTENGTYLVPTSLEDDAFSMVVPTGPALQYLEDAQRVDAGLSRIGAQVALSGHDIGLADSTQIHGIGEIAQLYLESASTLEKQEWPPSDRPDVDQFVKTQKALSQALWAWANGRQHSLLQLDTILEQSHGPAAINNLRRVLGLPSI